MDYWYVLVEKRLMYWSGHMCFIKLSAGAQNLLRLEGNLILLPLKWDSNFQNGFAEGNLIFLVDSL